MDNITAVGDWINEKYGFSNKTMNLNNHYDAAKLRDLNMSVRNLKGMSIAFDGMMAILGLEKTKLSIPITFRVNKDDYFTKQNIDEWKHLFDSVTEFENYYVIKTLTVGNNEAGTWTDVNGLTISEQMSEVTANIHDAVKEAMGFNFNDYTISVFRLLSATPMSSIFNDKPNRFLVPYLFVHQPILISFSNTSNIIRSETLKVNASHAIAKTRLAWETRLYKHLVPYLETSEKEKHKEITAIIKSKIKDDVIYLKRDVRNILHEFVNELLDTTDLFVVESADTLIKNIDTSNNYTNLSIIDKIKYLKSQLDILNNFASLNKTSDTITTSISTFNTDKVKVSFDASRKFARNVMNLLCDVEKLYESVENENKRHVSDSLREVDYADNIKDKIRIYKNLISSLGFNLDMFSKLNVGKQPLVQVMFPYLFEDNIDVRGGQYNQMQSYLYGGFNIIDQAWKPLFPTEYGALYEAKYRILRNIA